MKATPLLILPLIATAHAGDASARTERSERAFRFDTIPCPAIDDAAATGKWVLVEGDRDPNGGEAGVLTDGKLPEGDDSPAANFFFAAGSEGGRLRLDLDKPTAIGDIASYSWHRGVRAPQVYTVWGARGDAEDFEPAPKRDTDPASVGWKKLGEIDTREAKGGGQQHAALVRGSEDAALGEFKHLLFDIRRSDDSDRFGLTFFSEIDVTRHGAAEPKRIEPVERRFEGEDGIVFIIDATRSPDLMKWAEAKLVPEIREWYPKLVEMMPSKGYEAPKEVYLTFKDDMGGVPAYAAGNRVSLSIPFFRSQLQGEALGCVIHELVHVVQQFGYARRVNRNPSRTPGWVTEGLADYVRWFLYEPESKGAEITRRNLDSARHDGSYRISANFIDWVAREHDKDLLEHLNAACREGRYTDEIWKERTGKSLEELSKAWISGHRERLQS